MLNLSRIPVALVRLSGAPPDADARAAALVLAHDLNRLGFWDGKQIITIINPLNLYKAVYQRRPRRRLRSLHPDTDFTLTKLEGQFAIRSIWERGNCLWTIFKVRPGGTARPLCFYASLGNAERRAAQLAASANGPDAPEQHIHWSACYDNPADGNGVYAIELTYGVQPGDDWLPRFQQRRNRKGGRHALRKT